MRVISIKAKNFMSFVDLELEFNSGLCLIDGYNYDDSSSNGAGKTSILDCIAYGLYGDLPRSTKVDEVSNRYAKGSTTVEVSMEGHGEAFTVIRSRSPIDLLIRCSDGSEKRGKDCKETQALINSMIGIDFNVFMNSVYFSASSKIQFVSAADNEKRQILTDLLGLSIFDKCYDLSHAHIKAYTVETTAINNNITLQKEYIVKIKKELSYLLTERDNAESIKSKKISELEKENRLFKADLDSNVNNIKRLKLDAPNKDDIVEQYGEIKEELKNEDEIRASYFKLDAQDGSLKATMEQDLAKIVSLKENINSVCSSCGQVIGPDHAKHEITLLKDNLKQLSSEYVNAQDLKEEMSKKIIELDKKKEQVAVLEGLLKDCDTIEYQMKMFGSKAEHLADLMSRNRKEIGLIEGTKNNYDHLINNKNQELKQLDEQLDGMTNEWTNKNNMLQQYVIMKDVYSKVKYYVFETVINELNMRLNGYLEPLFDSEIFVQFLTQMENSKGELKHKFNMTIIKAGKTCSFNTLSDGEKRRVEIATGFALSDIVANRSKSMFNLLFLDEIMSGALSKDAAERVVDLLKTLKANKNILIIDHNAYTKELIDNVIFVEKRNNISKIVVKDGAF